MIESYLKDLDHNGKSTLKEIYINDDGVILRWRDGSNYEKYITDGKCYIVGKFVRMLE